MGVTPVLLPGHEEISDTSARERWSSKWASPVPMTLGMGTLEMMRAVTAGRVKSMVVLGDHTHLEDGTLGDSRTALRDLDFLVVADAFMTEVALSADVVFPTKVWAEKRGTFTNLERRVQPVKQVVDSKNSDVRSTIDILSAIGAAMGNPGFGYENSTDVTTEIAVNVGIYAGITYERLIEEGVETAKPSNDNPQPTQVMYSDVVCHGLLWPCPSAEYSRTNDLYAEGFRYGKATLVPLLWEGPPEIPNGFSLMLVPGRVLVQPGQDVKVVEVDGINLISRTQNFVLSHEDAAKANVVDQQLITVVTKSGREIAGTAIVSEKALSGVISMTTLFGDLATEVQANEHPDPMNHISRLRPEAAYIKNDEKGGK